MEVTIQCPHCQMELEAPADLEGKPAICPGCQAQFIVRAVRNEESESDRSGNGHTVRDESGGHDQSADEPTSGASHRGEASSESSSASRKSKSRSSKRRRSQPSTESEPTTTAEDRSESSNASGPRFKGLDAGLMAELQGAPGEGTGETQSQLTEPRPKAAQPQPATRNVKPQKRKRKAARLLSGETAETWLPLGADGQLPELVVKDEQQAETQKRDTSESNPLLLVAVLVGSVAMSLLLLFVPEEGPGNTGTLTDSLQALETSYIGKGDLKPYQLLVRKALEFEHEGERGQAKEVYRQLLDMLHAEKRSSSEFLTGPAFSSKEPNDRSFEKHLKVLLSN